MDKAERLAQIMYEEDEIRYNNNEDTIYFTKEDFEAECEERRIKNDNNTTKSNRMFTRTKRG